MWSLIGNENVVAGLAESLRLGRGAHAYLIEGPAGVGKMTLALDLAQALNCTGDMPPCGECVQCDRIAQGKHADVQVIGLRVRDDDEGGSHKELRIEQIKELQQAAGLSPFEGSCKVFIIDGAEDLNGEAANRLLKTLEEPPSTVCIVLLSSDVARLLPTITSRCRKIVLRPLSADAVEQALISHCKTEPERAATLSRLAEGRIGWAVSAASDEAVMADRSIQLDEVALLSGQGYHDRISLAGKLATRYGRDPEDIHGWLGLMEQWWRDLLLVKGGRPDLTVNSDRQDELSTTSQSLPLGAIADALVQTRSVREHLEKNVNPRLALDVLMLNLPLIRKEEAAAAT
jgi:DNA polymerase-3 subunit delta'